MAVFLVPAILHIGSWKEVFWITGGLGFIWLIFWIFFYNTPEKSKYLTKDEYNFIKAGQGLVPAEQSTEKLNLFKFFHHKQTWAYITGKALIDPIFWFFLFWLPSYFASSFSLDLKKPSWELMIIYTATTIGSIGCLLYTSRCV